MLESPEIERSRTLRLGMTEPEIAAVMGKWDRVRTELRLDGTTSTLLFGQSSAFRKRVYDEVRFRTGDVIPNWEPHYEDWPVRVRFDKTGRRRSDQTWRCS